jgi:hypothetical protein
MSLPTLSTFVIGCIGATAPEVVRLYNLRSEPRFQWSWGYVLYSIPFILLGGFIAWILEPSSKYAAFYAGISTPVLVTAVAKNSSLGTSSSPPETPPPPLPAPSIAPSLPSSPVEDQRRGKGVEPGAPVIPVPASPPQVPYAPSPSSISPPSIPMPTSRGQVRNPISLRSFLKALY